jgi:hypothetical protein
MWAVLEAAYYLYNILQRMLGPQSLVTKGLGRSSALTLLLTTIALDTSPSRSSPGSKGYKRPVPGYRDEVPCSGLSGRCCQLAFPSPFMRLEHRSGGRSLEFGCYSGPASFHGSALVLSLSTVQTTYSLSLDLLILPSTYRK